jgi:hypothetical protein
LRSEYVSSERRRRANCRTNGGEEVEGYGFNETINPDSIDVILTGEPAVHVPTLHVRVNRFQLGHSLTRGGTSSCVAAPASSARIEHIALRLKERETNLKLTDTERSGERACRIAIFQHCGSGSVVGVLLVLSATG